MNTTVGSDRDTVPAGARSWEEIDVGGQYQTLYAPADRCATWITYIEIYSSDEQIQKKIDSI